MKTNKILKVMSIIIAIVILIMVSFVGIYVKKNGRLENVVKDFSIGSELGTGREYVISLTDETTTEYYDSEGNLVPSDEVDSDAPEGTYTTKEVAINSEDAKTAENYEKVRDLVEKRIKSLGLEEYIVTVNEENGDIVLKTAITDQIDDMIYAIYGKGEFMLKDTETGEVLMDNNDIKDAKVAYYNSETGTNVYLAINFNKEGKNKLKDISSTYTKKTEMMDVTAEDGTVSQQEEDVTKKVDLYIDGNKITSSYFGEPIENGQLQLTMGEATDDVEELQSILLAAGVESTKLTYGPMPLVYEVAQSVDIKSNYIRDDMVNFVIVAVLLITAVLIYFVIKFKERAIMASILFVGFTALYLLVMKYANLLITPSAVMGFALVEVFIIVFINNLLDKLKKYDINETTPKTIINTTIYRFAKIMLPVLIVSIVFSLFTLLPISSLGLTLFWGVVLFEIYSYLFVKTLLLNYEYLFEEE